MMVVKISVAHAISSTTTITRFRRIRLGLLAGESARAAVWVLDMWAPSGLGGKKLLMSNGFSTDAGLWVGAGMTRYERSVLMWEMFSFVSLFVFGIRAPAGTSQPSHRPMCRYTPPPAATWHLGVRGGGAER